MQHGEDPNGSGQTGTPPTDHGGDQTGTPATTQQAGPSETVLRMRRYSTATGYIALVLLGLTLLVGPANLLLRKRTPLSSYLARDIGICAAIASVAHVVFGFLVKHVDGKILSYFFETGDRSRILTNSFGLAIGQGLLPW